MSFITCVGDACPMESQGPPRFLSFRDRPGSGLGHDTVVDSQALQVLHALQAAQGHDHCTVTSAFSSVVHVLTASQEQVRVVGCSTANMAQAFQCGLEALESVGCCRRTS